MATTSEAPATGPVPLLIIDDLASSRCAPGRRGSARPDRRSATSRPATLVTSNLDFTEWDQAFPATALASAVDRLRHNAIA
ncbi:MAG: ATP-binding protein [Zoogloea sp.]|nr:ATP-binding protein [Zoogloea sp.]